jgi:hypothetical protein
VNVYLKEKVNGNIIRIRINLKGKEGERVGDGWTCPKNLSNGGLLITRKLIRQT